MSKLSETAREISLTQPSYAFRYSICSLVTKMDEFEEMLQSLESSGFTREICEYLYINNTNGNRHDAFSGFNALLSAAKGQYILFCHQDILFKYDGLRELESIIEKLNHTDPSWGALGNAGMSAEGDLLIHISHPNQVLRRGKLPARCESLDENFLVVKAATGLRMSNDLKSFHFYGTDICQSLKRMGYTSWVVDFHLFHKSSGIKGADFIRAARDMELKLRQIRRLKRIFTNCATLYVGNSRFARAFNDYRRLYYAKKDGFIPSINELIEGSGALRLCRLSLLPIFWLLHRLRRPFENLFDRRRKAHEEVFRSG